MSSPTSPSPTERPIRVTNHALTRARERYPDLRLLAERDLLRLMTREVGEGYRSHRVAKHAPREVLVHPSYSKRPNGRHARYVWNEKRTHVYIVRRIEGISLVVSVLAVKSSG